jgi:HSP20 family protein
VLRFDPFRDLDRMAEQLLGAPTGTARAPRFMPMDLYRTGDHYVLNVDLPGVDPGSIDVNVENSTLTIRAERTAPNDASTDHIQWIGSERPTGTFQRQLALGDGIASDNISATYADGVLSLTIPVAEKAKARKVQVTSGSTDETRPSVSSNQRQEIAS